ncbi:MAG: recombination-associated protein RdgC, partial [Rhodocyclaceae bacterium]|nr:recombination-associated protein RdgC [Rhodocyclaceae bacterium]
DMFSRGWVFPRGTGQFVQAINGHWLIALGIEQKILPASVVRAEAATRAAKIEAEQERKVGRKEMRDLIDRVTEELLPRALTRLRTTWCWIDPAGGWLVINAGADARVDEFIEVLQKSVDGIALRPLQAKLSPSSAMTDWLAAGEAPAGFTIDQDLELRSTSEGQAAIRYVRHALEGQEIQRHIASGKIATRLGLTWNDRISFVLTGKLQIKRLTFLDILKDEAEQNAETADEQFDVDFTIMAGELTRMFDDVIAALGGMVVPS